MIKMMRLKNMADFFSFWYLQYTLNTAVYMLEPMERKIFNAVLVLVFAIFMYSGYLFLPGHAVMMVHFFEYLFMTKDDTNLTMHMSGSEVVGS